VGEIGVKSSLSPVFLMLYPGYQQYPETEAVDELRQFVAEGSLMIDVGANVGLLSAFRNLGRHPRGVILLEPEDQDFKALY